uniref:Uncharacterized protein n=1 Tax=Romanomermis culicivorax TaxID=13658 RepID=A0A915HKD6_ROMCU
MIPSASKFSKLLPVPLTSKMSQRKQSNINASASTSNCRCPPETKVSGILTPNGQLLPGTMGDGNFSEILIVNSSFALGVYKCQCENAELIRAEELMNDYAILTNRSDIEETAFMFIINVILIHHRSNKLEVELEGQVFSNGLCLTL